MEHEKIKKLFAKELALFNNPQVRNFTIEILAASPDYFTKINEDGTENEVLLQTKNSVYIAEILLQSEHYRHTFSLLDMDVIRSALLLRDGCIYGNDEKTKTIHPEHVLETSQYIKGDYWEQCLPLQIRTMIADAVESHIYGIQKETANVSFQIRIPQNELEWFVNDCNRLSSAVFPIVAPNAVPIKAVSESDDAIPFDTALSMSKQIVRHKRWDGTTQTDTMLGETYIFLNGQKTDVPVELRRAMQTLGHARIAQRSPFFNGPVVYNYDNFRKKYPEWTGEVFGTYNHYYVKIINEDTTQDMPITNEQASMFGVNVNQRQDLGD